MLVEKVIGSIGVEMSPSSVGDVYLKSVLCSTATWNCPRNAAIAASRSPLALTTGAISVSSVGALRLAASALRSVSKEVIADEVEERRETAAESTAHEFRDVAQSCTATQT